jgi:hypothetical protein
MRNLIFTCIAATLVAAPMTTIVKAEETTIIKRDRDGEGDKTAGWLVATAAGAAVGGTAGGIIGALTQAGTSQEDAYLYAEGVRRGGTLVSARVAEADRARYEAVLDRLAVDIRDRGAAWRKAGWQNFDPKAAPYTAEQIRRERELYRSSGGTR